jgi:6-phosphogluconolactonase (cycloisomerase 2 family)
MRISSSLSRIGTLARRRRALVCVGRAFTRTGILLVLFSALLAPSALAQDYLVTNDDSFTNGVSFFTIGSGGALTFVMNVPGPGLGIGGGLFGMSRIAAVNSGNTQCIFASEAFTNDVFWIVPGSGIAGGSTPGSQSDDGSANGVGLAANAQYLYASFSSSNTIATFQVQSACTLVFASDIAVGGLNGGPIDGMAIHGNMLVASYADGSIESFNIASGTPVSNGDKQNSTASAGGESYPNGIDITQDGHFAIFGDTSTADIVEVSDISSGRLTPTVVYRTHAGINSSNVLLSPDETILYISNTQGDVVTAAFFNKNTGAITRGCTSPRVKQYVDSWSYLGSMTLQQTTGNGGGVFVAEFGGPSWIASLNLSVNGTKCTLKEPATSPIEDVYSHGLLSIGRFPPRQF